MLKRDMSLLSLLSLEKELRENFFSGIKLHQQKILVFDFYTLCTYKWYTTLHFLQLSLRIPANLKNTVKTSFSGYFPSLPIWLKNSQNWSN